MQANTYNVEILNSFDLRLQLKDTESTIRNKLKDLLTEFRGYKFMATLVLEFKKQNVMIKQNIAPFIQPQKQKQLLMKVILMTYFNESIVQLYQIHKNHLEKVQVGLSTGPLLVIEGMRAAVKRGYSENQYDEKTKFKNFQRKT